MDRRAHAHRRRLLRPGSQPPGSRNTTTSPRWISSGLSASLFTSTRSLTSSVSSIDSDGMQERLHQERLDEQRDQQRGDQGDRQLAQEGPSSRQPLRRRPTVCFGRRRRPTASTPIVRGRASELSATEPASFGCWNVSGRCSDLGPVERPHDGERPTDHVARPGRSPDPAGSRCARLSSETDRWSPITQSLPGRHLDRPEVGLRRRAEVARVEIAARRAARR